MSRLVSGRWRAGAIVSTLATAVIGLTALPAQAAIPPHITGHATHQQGVMVVLSVTYSGTADGFGFKGINGSGWAEESHPLSSPSYGHVSPGKVEYPFNHACGTSHAYQSDVEFWVYSGATRSTTTAHLACSGQTTGNGTTGNGGATTCSSPPSNPFASALPQMSLSDRKLFWDTINNTFNPCLMLGQTPEEFYKDVILPIWETAAAGLTGASVASKLGISTSIVDVVLNGLAFKDVHELVDKAWKAHQ